jgi:ABC-type transport system involved in cytochrome bd biosynthesis fused ATPase/permease subunit
LEEAGLNISGGERQRLALARGILRVPGKDILLLDEPTAGVDRPTQHALAQMLGELHRHSGRAVVLVTHEFAPFRDIAKRFVWVQDGALRELSAADFHGRHDKPQLPN